MVITVAPVVVMPAAGPERADCWFEREESGSPRKVALFVGEAVAGLM